MKKIFRLTINELIKQIYKKNFVITLTILICFAILFPLMMPKYVRNNLYMYDGYQPYFGLPDQMGMDVLTYFDEDVDGKYHDLEGGEDYILFITEYKRELSKYKDIRATVSSLRWNIYESIISGIRENIVAELKISGVNIEDNGYFKKFSLTQLVENKTDEELQQMIDYNNKKRIMYDDIVLNYDLHNYFQINYEILLESLKLSEETLEYYQNINLDDSHMSQEEINNQIKIAEDNIKLSKTYKEFYEYLLNREVKGADNEYIVNYIDRYGNLYHSINSEILSEEDYPAFDYSSYEEYVTLMKMEKEQQKKDIEILKYAILNDINYDKNGIKKAFELFYVTLPIFVGIFVIGFTSTIVADETSKSTIKSLVSKPNKKWKVLTSKFLASLIIMIISIIVYSFCYILGLFIAYGVSDLSIPMLIYDNGIVEMNYMLYVFKEILVCVIPLIFVTLFSVCVSTYFSVSMISAAVSAVILVGHTVLTPILGLANENIIVYAFLPHLNIFKLSENNTLILWNNKYNYSFTFGNSLLILGCNILLFIVIAYIIFTKKEIK